MNIQTQSIPEDFINVAQDIPQEYLEAGAESRVIDYLSSRVTNTLGLATSRHAVVLRMDEAQLKKFHDDLTQPTPHTAPGTHEQHLNRFGVLQLAVAKGIGEPLSISNVRNGIVLQDIFPTDSKRTTPSSSYGSEEEFVFHNDQSYLDDSEIPDYVTLGCVRNKEEAITEVADVNAALEGLEQDDTIELRKAAYIFRHTFHRGSPEQRVGEKISPALLENGEIRIGVDMEALDDGARSALDRLRIALKKVAVPYKLRPGDILITPNKFTAHARNPFSLLPNPNERRWLQRVNIRTRTPPGS